MELALIEMRHSETPLEVKNMSMTKEAVQVKLADKNVVVLNVLPSDDFKKIHITGSLNIPMGLSSADFVQAVDKKFGKDPFFITYCAGLNCSVGSSAAKALREKGFKADDLPGGIQEWSQAGFPTEGTESGQLDRGSLPAKPVKAATYN
jgi:rhodanese-related sulfurtransferase